MARCRRDDLEVIATRKAKRIPEEPVTYADGTTHWLTTTKVPLIRADGRCDRLLAVATEITERMQMEEALRISEERLRRTLDAAQTVAWEGDLQGEALVETGPVAALLGLPPGAVGTGRSAFVERVHPQDRQRVLAAMQSGATGQDAYEVEYRILLPDGNVRWIQATGGFDRDADGRPIRLRGIARDITGRKQAEEALHRERDRAQGYLDVAEVMLLALDETGHITLINRKGSQILGYEQPELLGRDWFDTCLPVSAREEMREIFGLLMAGEAEPVEYVEGVVRTRSGAERILVWHNTIVREETGRIVGILSMDDPVDGRRPAKEALAPLELFLHQAAMVIENAQLIESLREARTQLEAYTEQLEQMVDRRTRQLRKSQEQLLKAQRLAVIGELAGMVGHDLRNPLTSIAGATYYLKKKLRKKTSSKLMEMLDLIENNIGYSNKIINDLLDYSREIKLDLTVSDPKSMVQNALVLIAIPKNVRLVDLTEKEPNLRIDNEKMKRVFANLIKNATDAMPRGGTLTIKSKNTKNHVEFVFADSGTGMTDETREKLWTPLFTTKAKGMGFGLPICKRFIEAHGGSISVESILRKGTTFTIVLPIEPKVKEEGGEKIWIRQPESSLLTMTKT